MAEEQPAANPGGSMKLIIILLVALLVIGIGVGVALFLMLGDKGGDDTTGDVQKVEKPTPKTPIYVPLHPAFLANFEDQTSAAFLQVDIQVMTYDSDVEKAIKTHMPRIRNDLLLLFSSQKYEDINTTQGKRKLSEDALNSVRKVLEDAGEPAEVEALLFTSFVMQ